jgi:hypothetical protein
VLLSLLLLLLQGPVRFGAGIVIKGDVTLDCSEATPVTIQATTFNIGIHKVAAPAEAPAVPAGAPAAAPAFA